jgi:hypothetical protein
VLTLAEAALDAHRPAGLIDDDHRMETVGLAGTTPILDFVTRAKHAIIEHWAFRIEHRAFRRIFAT